MLSWIITLLGLNNHANPSMLSLKQERYFNWFVLGMAFVVIVLGYHHILNAPFLWDDEVMVVQNIFIQKWSYLKEIFTSSAFGETAVQGRFYRPFQIFTYNIDYQVWGLNAFGFHLTSLCLHGLNTTLFFLVLKRLLKHRLSICVITLIYAIHPIHIESVTYISGRGDVLFLTFNLLSIWLFLKGCQHNSRSLWWVPVMYLGSLLTKENGMPLPLFLAGFFFLYDDLAFKRSKKSILIVLGGLMTMMIVYTVWRLGGAIGAGNGTLSHIAYASTWERLLTVPWILLTYLKLFIFPYPLHMEYHHVTKQLSHPSIWLGIPVIIGVIALSIKGLQNKKMALVYWSWFFIGLGPVYCVLVPLASTLREHWLCFPALGLWLLLGLYIDENKNRFELDTTVGKVFVGSLFVSVLLLLGATYERNQQWTDPALLYEHDVQLEPKSFLLHNNLGVIQYRNKDYKKAKASFEASIKNSPNPSGYGTAHNNLGVIIENEGDLNAAAEHYFLSIRHSKYYLGYTNLTRIWIIQGKWAQAYKVAEEGLVTNPFSEELLYYATFLSLKLNQKERALGYFNRLRQHFPKSRYIPALVKGAA